MIVMKFGGTSVGSPERMKHVASLITNSGNQFLSFCLQCQVRQIL